MQRWSIPNSMHVHTCSTFFFPLSAFSLISTPEPLPSHPLSPLGKGADSDFLRLLIRLSQSPCVSFAILECHDWNFEGLLHQVQGVAHCLRRCFAIIQTQTPWLLLPGCAVSHLYKSSCLGCCANQKLVLAPKL